MVYGIRRFVYNTFFFLVLLCAVGLAYRHLFHGRIVPLVIAAVLLTLYGLTAGISAWGMTEMKKYEAIQNARGILPEDHPKILLCALTIPLPLHFCTLLASLIPITTWEVWFITIFPCIFLTFQPIRAVADVYDLYTRKKRLFWSIQILLVLTITLSMQTIVQTFL